jgi:hypothetical protein
VTGCTTNKGGKVAEQPKRDDAVVDMHISPRNLLLVVALFAGGATGGGVLTFANGNTVPTSLAADVRELKAELASLTTTMAKIEGALTQRRDDISRVEKILDDHESRIRRVEAVANKGSTK